MENKTNMIPDEQLETVSGGTDIQFYESPQKNQVGDVIDLVDPSLYKVVLPTPPTYVPKHDLPAPSVPLYTVGETVYFTYQGTIMTGKIEAVDRSTTGSGQFYYLIFLSRAPRYYVPGEDKRRVRVPEEDIIGR